MRLGPTKTIELFVGPIMGLKGSDLISSLRTSRDKLRHKKARRACAVRALRTSSDDLVITDGEFWWSWRELNPRPKSYILGTTCLVSLYIRLPAAEDTPLTN